MKEHTAKGLVTQQGRNPASCFHGTSEKCSNHKKMMFPVVPSSCGHSHMQAPARSSPLRRKHLSLSNKGVKAHIFWKGLKHNNIYHFRKYFLLQKKRQIFLKDLSPIRFYTTGGRPHGMKIRVFFIRKLRIVVRHNVDIQRYPREVMNHSQGYMLISPTTKLAMASPNHPIAFGLKKDIIESLENMVSVLVCHSPEAQRCREPFIEEQNE